MEAAVDSVIKEGYRTPDIGGAASHVVDTVKMGALVAERV